LDYIYIYTPSAREHTPCWLQGVNTVDTTHVHSAACIVVNRDSTLVCRVDGRCVSQYISSDPYKNDHGVVFSGKPGTAKKKKRAQRRLRPAFDDSAASGEVVKVLTNLLFGKARATLCCEDAQKGARAKQSVHHRRKRTLRALDPAGNYPTEDITVVVIRMLAMVHNTGPPGRTNSVILGTLYLMQHGKSFDGLDIPRSCFLYDHLPSITDLPAFGYQRSAVRVGKNTIIACARS